MNYIVAITGASGSIYARHLLKALAREGAQIQLIISNAGRLVIEHELEIKLANDNNELKNTVKEQLLGDANYPYLELHDINDLTAAISSGSVPTQGMIVLPCSMGTLGRIAQGNSNNLIERSADVVLKEKRPLILAPRETPVNYIHLRNMMELSRAGAHIVPCMPAYYQKPQTIGDLADFMAGKIFDVLGITHSLFRRWKD